MIDLGRHAAFIWSSYGVVALVLAALIVWLITDGRRLNRLLADFEARGITRRSARGAAPGASNNSNKDGNGGKGQP